jgi:hypothetical protein
MHISFSHRATNLPAGRQGHRELLHSTGNLREPRKKNTKEPFLHHQITKTLKKEDSVMKERGESAYQPQINREDAKHREIRTSIPDVQLSMIIVHC